jgi:hypothetical protein
MAIFTEFIDPSIVQNLGKELLNIVGTEVKTADTSLYERKSLKFRDIIDTTFPTMLVIDYANIKTELSQYKDLDAALKDYMTEKSKESGKTYSGLKLSDKEVDYLLQAIKIGIKRVPSKPISYKSLQVSLSNIINSDKQSNTIVQQVKQLFNTTYKLTDFSGDVEVFIFPNFVKVGETIRAPLGIGLAAVEASISSQTISGIDSIGQILNYGHTALGYIDNSGNAKLNFNSPKSLAIMFDAIESGTNSPKANAIQSALKANSSFVTDTKQTDVYITIDKEFSDGFVKLFVSVGGNSVKLENSVVNSLRGSSLESTKQYGGVNKVVLDKLAKAFTNTESTIGKRLTRFILKKRSSPNVIDYLFYNISSVLKGTPVSNYSGKAKESLTTKKINVSKEVVGGIAKTKVKLPKLPKPATTVRNVQGRFTSLASLQSMLNLALAQQVQQNMGTGTSRNVLNYRTGRFAESAQVTSLSQSRAGMITAFYTYMRNPYGTFSEGGAQGSPPSRDPKLLISKSIREVLATQVNNRLRAVLA